MASRKLQLILILSSIALALVLFLAPSQVNMTDKDKKAEEQKSGNKATGFDADELLKSARTALDKKQVAQLDSLESGLKQGSAGSDTSLLANLGRFWDRQNIPAASAVWFERKAEVQKSERSYLEAAYRYFDSFKIAQDSSLRTLLVEKAIANYQRVLTMNPNNLDAKTDLGACFVEGTGEPMKGIMMLREVVQTDPNHEMAQFNLGMLSVKSGQFAKAIDRFNKVLVINPKRAEIYIYLGQVYMKMGDTPNAILNYQLFTKKSDDYEAVAQVGKMIEELKKGSSIQ
jgi:tetratricopeptide (TPR) repeat protein